jgi:hypothetical protein
LILALAIHRAPPTGPPLYDGVVVVEPYIWLDPPTGQLGGALPKSTTVAVESGRNRIVAVATDESPPQAQLLATSGSLTLAPGATSLSVSITPAAPVQPVPTGYLDGNVYRYAVVDQLGRAATAAAVASVTIFLRSANPADLDATVERFDGTSWVPIETTSEGDAGFLAIVTEFGDYAVVGNGPSPYATPALAATVAPSILTITATAAPKTSGPSTRPTLAPEGPSLPGLATAGVGLLLSIGALALLARRRRRRDHR